MADNWAIAVGINQYEHFPPNQHLHCAIQDAERVRAFLCDRARFKPENILLCTDTSDPVQGLSTQPTRPNLRRLLREKLPPPKQVNNFWFFFSGHGAIGSDRHDYLMTRDTVPTDLEATALAVDFITDHLRQYTNAVLILDACRNELADSSKGVDDAIGTQTLALARQQGITTIFSCRRTQRSYELEALQQGSFTHALLEGLQQHTILESLDQYLQKRVPQLNQQHGKPAQQIPLVIPEPGERYRLPLLLECVTEQDVQRLEREAFKAEVEENFAEAIHLWQQVAIAAPSPATRSEAVQAIARITRKQLATISPTPPPPTSPLPIAQSPPPKPKDQKPITEVDCGNGVKLELVAIAGGNFLMGSPQGKGDKDEYPQHEVTLQPFLLGKYPVTQQQWLAVMGSFREKPGFEGGDRPIERVSWNDAVEFCQRLSEKTGLPFRLPSEAEWEYACRAGSTGDFCFGDDENLLGQYAWYGDNSNSQTHPVGQKQPNAWGLYDMHGNVWEWCADPWHENYDRAPNDGRVWELEGDRNNRLRLLRGGSWVTDPRNCRSAFRRRLERDFRYYSIGFRVACFSPRT